MITLNTLLFLAFSLTAIISTIMVISAKNPVYSVFFLILTFISTSGVFLMFGIEFIPMVYIILYVGAIAILFLFVVMMLDIKLVELVDIKMHYFPIVTLIIIMFFFDLYFFLESDIITGFHMHQNTTISTPIEPTLLTEFSQKNTVANIQEELPLILPTENLNLAISKIDSIKESNIKELLNLAIEKGSISFGADIMEQIKNLIKLQLSPEGLIYFNNGNSVYGDTFHNLNNKNDIYLFNKYFELEIAFMQMTYLTSLGHPSLYFGELETLIQNDYTLNYLEEKIKDHIIINEALKGLIIDLENEVLPEIDLTSLFPKNFCNQLKLDPSYFNKLRDFLFEFESAKEIVEGHNKFYTDVINVNEVKINELVAVKNEIQEFLQVLFESTYNGHNNAIFDEYYTNIDDFMLKSTDTTINSEIDKNERILYIVKDQIRALKNHQHYGSLDNVLTEEEIDLLLSEYLDNHMLFETLISLYETGFTHFMTQALNFIESSSIKNTTPLNISTTSSPLEYVNWNNIVTTGSNIQNIGQILYTYHFILFIIAGLILLVAMIGAIVLTLYSQTKVKRQDVFNQTSRHFTNSINLKK